MMPASTVHDFFQAIIAKDADAIMSFYDPSPGTYVILEGPRLSTLGFDRIKKGWGDFVQSPISLESIFWKEGPFYEETEQMAWVAGIIRLRVCIKERAFEQVFRGSFVLKKSADRWTICHEHVSGALQDPYGIGDWLKQ